MVSLSDLTPAASALSADAAQLQAAAAQAIASLSNTLKIGSLAGGSLAGTYPNPKLAASSAVGKVYNVQAYGAFGDGLTHTITAVDIAAHPEWVGTYTAGYDDWDTVGIQEAIYACLATPRHSGTAYFPAPAQYYRVTSTIKCFGLAYPTAHLNMYAEAGGDSNWLLKWFGPTDVNAGGICLEVLDNWNTVFQNITVANQQARGSSIGILISKQISGTGDSGNTYINSTAYGFHVGIQAGGGVLAPGAASEQTFINCGATYCDIGVLTVGFNTLNLYWICLVVSQNGTGAIFQEGNNFVIGGSASSNSLGDFKFQGGGVSSLEYFRSENGAGPLVDTGGTVVMLLGNSVSNPPATGPSVILGANATMVGNRINGYVQVRGSSGGPYTMLNNEVQPAPVSGDVFDIIGTVVDFAYDLRTNIKFGVNDHFDDRMGYGNIAVAAGFQGALQRSTRSVKQIASQDFRAVQGLSGSPFQAKNLRGTAVLSGGIAQVVFGVTEVQSLQTSGGPTGGTVTVRGPHSMAINPLLPFNASAAAVQAALLTLPSYPYSGFLFASGDVACAGGPLGVAPVTITYAGPRAASPQTLLTVTAALTGGVSPTATLMRVVAGSFAEIDANYTVQLTGNSNETFWVTGKAATGFTIHSSNPASTASVDWMLVR